MAQYHVCLFVFTLIGLNASYGENSTAVGLESTPPSLKQEVEDNSRYKTLEANATLLKLLVDDKAGVSRSEVFDMLNSHDEAADHMDMPSFPEDAEDSRADAPVPDAQAEFLQTADAVVLKDSEDLRSANRGEPFSTAAIIMVGITCSIVFLAYTALIVWRRIYLQRSGLKHVLLRNEDNIAETRIQF